MKYFTAIAAMAAILFVGLGAPTGQAGETGRFLTRYGGASSPNGFSGVCSAYGWACSTSASGTVADSGAMMSAASSVNSHVNGSIRTVSDMAQYGRAERWVLPTTGMGDCEDFALMKAKLLIERGVPAKRLRMALVMARHLSEPHIVLVMRTSGGDYVLDSLRSGIRRWDRTGYTFVKMQNERNKARWDAVLLGPNATRTTASRIADNAPPAAPAANRPRASAHVTQGR